MKTQDFRLRKAQPEPLFILRRRETEPIILPPVPQTMPGMRKQCPQAMETAIRSLTRHRRLRRLLLQIPEIITLLRSLPLRLPEPVRQIRLKFRLTVILQVLLIQQDRRTGLIPAHCSKARMSLQLLPKMLPEM